MARALSWPERYLVAPRRGEGVCSECFNLTDGHRLCYACSHQGGWLEAVVPISYSLGGSRLHQTLRAYKQPPPPDARWTKFEITLILSHFLARHGSCLERTLGKEPLVTTVPSGARERDESHPLHSIVGRSVPQTRDRYERMLRRSTLQLPPHRFHPQKYYATRPLEPRPVLLIDDTWTTGASARAAGAALRRAGSGQVVLLTIGRHLNRGWHENERRLAGAAARFDWGRCALCAEAPR